MILEEMVWEITDYVPPATVIHPENTENPAFAGLTANELRQILYATALVQATEELTSTLAGAYRPSAEDGTPQDKVIGAAKKLGFNADELMQLDEFRRKFQLPFFINSLGPHLVNVVDGFLSTKYFRDQGRTGQQDKDFVEGYYRTSTGTAIGIGSFSALNEHPQRNMIEEVLKVALGFSDALSKIMPEHFSYPKIGIHTETSMIGGSIYNAMGAAVALSPLYRRHDAAYAPDSLVHLNVGDSAVNEPVFSAGFKMLGTQSYLIARHVLGLTDTEIEQARKNPEKRKEIYSRLDDSQKLHLVVSMFNNNIGISCNSDVVHEFNDPLGITSHLERSGLLTRIDYEGTDFLQVLNIGRQKLELGRKGIVVSDIRVPRPGGHSASNYYGQGKLGEITGSPVPGLTLDQAIYHNNVDPLMNAIRTSIDYGILTPSDAKAMIETAKKEVMRTLIGLAPKYRPKNEEDLGPVTGYDSKTAQELWKDLIVLPNTTRRNKLWLGTGGGYSHAGSLNGFGRGLELSEIEVNTLGKPTLDTTGNTKRVKKICLPEELKSISPMQAENYSLADLTMLSGGNFFGIGQDIPDANPFSIDYVAANPTKGLGGINHATARLQVLVHTMNPKTGRYQIMDTGINEAEIYARALAFKQTHPNAQVLMEIQFNDYDFPVFDMERITSMMQLSNGQEKVPIIMRHTYGFLRGGDFDKFWKTGGAAGTYHSSCHVGSLMARYPGLVIEAPNTAEAVQMAYRRAAVSDAPTLIMMSSPVMKSMKIGSFDYSGKYLPLNTPLEELGTPYFHPTTDNGRQCEVPEHDVVLLTYGEYVPICYKVAEDVFKEKGIKTLVVDYNTLSHRDTGLAEKIIEQYRSVGWGTPNMMIVSQEGENGFGACILNDLESVRRSLEQVEIPFLHKLDRRSEWLAEHLIYPHPDKIKDTILSLSPARRGIFMDTITPSCYQIG